MDAAAGSVAVIGGGLAGLAAACLLADRGRRVTLVEERPFAGGRACSYLDRTSGLEIDNGQHLFLRCCERYIAFLNSIGAGPWVTLQPALEVDIWAGGRRASLRRSGWPAPLHLAPSLLRYGHLSLPERMRVLRGALSALLERSDRANGLSFQNWLMAHGQTDRTVARFWNLISLAALNADARDAGVDQALMVLRTGFLGAADAADLGAATVSLGAVASRAVDRLLSLGGRVALGRRARRLATEGGMVLRAELSDGEQLTAEQFLCAVPPDRLLALLPEEWSHHSHFRAAAALNFSPIANIHLWYDRPVADRFVMASLGTAAQWVFDKGALLGLPGMAGRYLLVTISDAREQLRCIGDLPRIVAKELQGILPRARTATLLRSRVTLEPHATIVAGPGAEAGRLPAKTPLGNLWLAGDWTRTGWPATMEGAVRSGEAAAEALLTSPRP